MLFSFAREAELKHVNEHDPFEIAREYDELIPDQDPRHC
jgi:hypothetical protein